MVNNLGSMSVGVVEPETESWRRVVEDACASPAARVGGWSVAADPDQPEQWLRVQHPSAHVPEQGWKLHVSATLLSAEETLRRTLPVLLAEPLAFKVAATPGALNALNNGTGALSQIGKFITVYPRDDDQAVRLGVALDEATRGLPGPAIPSDRALRAGSVVHYRYGGFGGLTVQRRNGEIVPALRTPNGELVPDVRRAVYQSPEWAVDPFLAANVADERTAPPPLIGGRYLLMAPLHRSARGSVYLAVDLDQPRRCVLKQATANSLIDRTGHDARDRLHHEAAVLRRLAPDPRFPASYGLIEQGDDVYLAMEDVAGETLEGHILRLARRGCTLPAARVVAWGRELAAMLGTIHDAGLVYRDLKSTNVIATPEGRLRLVDFELSAERGGAIAPGTGTRGYLSPQQDAGAPPAVTDDVYGLGALLVYMATGAEPSQAPRPFALLDRPLRLVNPAISPALASVVARCLDPDPPARFPDMAAVDAALAAVEPYASVVAPAYGGESVASPETEHEARRRSRDLARRLGDTLCTVAEPAPVGRGLTWVSRHPLTAGMRARDLNTGAAGTLLALAEIVADLDIATHREVLRAGVDWLADAPRPGAEPLPGLYVGEAGVGAALLRAGQVLREPAPIESAVARGRSIATMPFESPDLFDGTAGRLRFHLLLWDETSESEHLAHALTAGEALCASAEDAGDGGVCWTIPSGFGGLSGLRYLGYAHGAAGIADALLDLFDATGDERFLEPARGAGRWLARQAISALDDGSGLNWPSTEGDESAVAYWCHGAAGIGRFFLHAAALDLLPEADEIATRALRTVARGTRWVAPPPCHGLTGGIELLLDAYQASGDPAHLTEARSLARLLEAFALEQDGLLVWPAESPVRITPDYMVGYAGVAATLLRLAAPDRRPHGLCRRGFRHLGQTSEVALVRGGHDGR
ncbi:MAG TPA: class IV lanthionine synthetase LanL [Thermomicrobiales bacterium]